MIPIKPSVSLSRQVTSVELVRRLYRGFALGFPLTAESAHLSVSAGKDSTEAPQSCTAAHTVERFISCLDGLECPRTGRAGRRHLYEILMIAFRGALCGGQSAVDRALFTVAEESSYATS